MSPILPVFISLLGALERDVVGNKCYEHVPSLSKDLITLQEILERLFCASRSLLKWHKSMFLPQPRSYRNFQMKISKIQKEHLSI